METYCDCALSTMMEITFFSVMLANSEFFCNEDKLDKMFSIFAGREKKKIFK